MQGSFQKRVGDGKLRATTALLLVLAAAAPHAQSRAPEAGGKASDDAKLSTLQKALERRLEQIAESVDGVMGYEVLDLTTGQRFGRLRDEIFPTASTIKLAILYELFKQADEGRLKLDDAIPLGRQHVVGGAGVLRELTAPAMPLRDYATLMIVLSDNTATNVVIDAVGVDKVTERVRAMGLRSTRLRRRMMDTDAARRGDENVSTPADITSLLAAIERGEGLSRASHDGLLRILKMTKSSPMRRSVPSTIEVANKPGTLEGVATDAGIVYVRRRPYIFCAMLTYLAAGTDGDAAIETASRAVYDYFTRVATSSEYGRTIR